MITCNGKPILPQPRLTVAQYWDGHNATAMGQRHYLLSHNWRVTTTYRKGYQGGVDALSGRLMQHVRR